jgi:hypothetical protein
MSQIYRGARAFGNYFFNDVDGAGEKSLLLPDLVKTVSQNLPTTRKGKLSLIGYVRATN